MSSKSNSGSNKQNINDDDNNNNSNFNPLFEGFALAQSSAIALLNTYSEILKAAPKMIDYWYNTFWNPWTRATATEEQKRDKVKVE
ncbi:MAG: hypothetical protein WCF06_11245 [Nitrososphaeraceae archaeon]